MSEWPVKRLGDLCADLTVGHVGSMASEYVERGIPFLRSQNVRKGRLDLDGLKYIPREFHQQLRKSQLQPGDIVMVRTGDPGAAALIPAGLGELNCADLVIARPGDGVDPRFLCYSINATAERYISAHLVGAVQQHFNVGSAKNLEISLPPLSVQQAIANLLGALDDKIAVNGKIAQGCDQMLSLQLDQWMQSNPGAVRECPLSSLAEFVNGRAFTKDATGTGRMVIRIAEINSGPGSSTVYNDIEVPDVHLARPGDVLFAWSGSLDVTRWFRSEGIINQHIFKVIPSNGIPAWLVFEMIDAKLAMFKGIAADKATTMGHIQRRHLDEPVEIPKQDGIAHLDGALGPLWERALSAELASLELAELRDSLLPRLMSGEIRVRDAEKVVEDVT
jgi:type I restriction enzyme, S subunit